MKQSKRFLALMFVLATLLFVPASAVDASASENYKLDETSAMPTEVEPFAAKLPTQYYNLWNGAYTGSISGLSPGFGSYTLYYFNPSSAGKLDVSGTFTCAYPGYAGSQVRFELVNIATKKVEHSWTSSKKSFNDTFISHTFTDLTAGTNYAVNFVNATASTTDYAITGPIEVSH